MAVQKPDFQISPARVRLHLLLRGRADRLEEIADCLHVQSMEGGALLAIAWDLRVMARLVEAELPIGCRLPSDCEIDRLAETDSDRNPAIGAGAKKPPFKTPSGRE